MFTCSECTARQAGGAIRGEKHPPAQSSLSTNILTTSDRGLYLSESARVLHDSLFHLKTETKGEHLATRQRTDRQP